MDDRLAKLMYESNFLDRLQKAQDDISLLQKLYVTAGFAPVNGNPNEVFFVDDAVDLKEAVNAQQIQAQSLTAFTTGGTSTAFTLTTLTTPLALTTNERWAVKFHATAGATPTLNRDGLGAKSLKYINAIGAAVACGPTNLLIGVTYDVYYDSTLTAYIVMEPSGFQMTSGWSPVSDTWTYASSSTITIPSDGTTVYQKGVKIRFKQGGGWKYYVGISVTATLVTVFVNTDYAVANAAITDISYSYAENPYGWPSFFNVTITAAGLTTPSYNSQAGKVQVLGRTLKFDGRLDINSWAAQTSYIKIVLPFAVNHVAGAGRGVGSYYRTGTSTQQGTHILTTLSTTEFGLYNNDASDNIGWEASARVVFQFQFLCDF